MPKKKKIPAKNVESKDVLRLLESAALITKENKQIDFKAKFDPTSSAEWSEIIKDIIAMANSGGGVILFGVSDEGSFNDDFDKNAILSIDPATIADKIYAYTNENFSEIKITELTRSKRKVPIFLVAAAEIPIVFSRAGADILQGGKQKPAFVRGSVYFRHGAKSEPGTTNDLKHALDRAINRTKKSWFEGVRKISNIKEGDEVIVQKTTMTSDRTLQPILGKIVSDASAPSFRPDNASELWPHRSKEIVKVVNEKMTQGKKITPHDIVCIKKKHAINEIQNPDLVYKPYKDVSPRYSDDFAEFIVKSITEKENFLEEAREYYKNSRPIG